MSIPRVRRAVLPVRLCRKMDLKCDNISQLKIRFSNSWHRGAFLSALCERVSYDVGGREGMSKTQ